MRPKQNVFADIEDSFDGEHGFRTMSFVAGFFVFLWAWIHFCSFVGALLVVIVGGPLLGGLAAFFIYSFATMFAPGKRSTG